MKKKPLSETNPYLKDPEKRRKGMITNVVSSSAIEGIKVSKKTIEKFLKSSVKR